LGEKHDFLIFEDRKFVDIGHTTQRQYHDGALRISEFAHIVNISILSGGDVVKALSQVIHAPDFPYPNERALILLAEMTSRGSLATGDYTRTCVDVARANRESVIGFVATRSLHTITQTVETGEHEDFIIFTTGISQTKKSDGLGQQYQTPTEAIQGGSDFVIAGRGIYASQDPEETAKSYQREGWEAYLKRLKT
jgi:orotidine-5'-phosphate decarboxylase